MGPRPIGLVLALLAGTPAVAQDSPAASRWLDELKGIDEELRAGSAPAALERSRRLVGELVQIKGGDGAPALVGTALAQLALAEAATDQPVLAAWHLALAEAFSPAFTETGFEEFGDAGSSLVEIRDADGADPPPPPFESLDVVPPRVVDASHIIVRGSREVLASLDPELTVTFTVDADGGVRRPRVEGGLDNPGPILLSLLVLREWRFEPAHRAGAPVATSVTVGLPLTEAVVEAFRQSLDG